MQSGRKPQLMCSTNTPTTSDDESVVTVQDTSHPLHSFFPGKSETQQLRVTDGLNSIPAVTGGGGYTPDRSPIYSRFTFTANLESPINLTKINASGVIIHTTAGRWTRTHDHYLADFSLCKPNIPVDAWFQSPVCYTLQ